jgi:hypothetical protein
MSELRRIDRFECGSNDGAIAAAKAEVDVERGQRAPGRPAILIDRMPYTLSRVVSMPFSQTATCVPGTRPISSATE